MLILHPSKCWMLTVQLLSDPNYWHMSWSLYLDFGQLIVWFQSLRWSFPLSFWILIHLQKVHETLQSLISNILQIIYVVRRSFQAYTLKRGISGKDLGKRGTALADKDVPEALGIVPGAIFLICLTFCLVGYASSHPTKVSMLVTTQFGTIVSMNCTKFLNFSIALHLLTFTSYGSY